MDAAFWRAQLDSAKQQAQVYGDAIFAFKDPTLQSYDLDTGQSRHRVTRQDLDKLHDAYDALLERVVQLELLCEGGGARTSIPWTY